ncbi:MAG TPA: cytochrome d ubiquinol oxidase subunit II [Rectinemataceae bacterium]|nr:cytochrome d ubiquinol oxidase subunit II [Rectinemataceae bacterium]
MALQTLWFVLWGLLWAVYFMLDGFDFGVGMLRNFIARDETERSLALAAIGPVWNGNEVWLITAGGATFAAFPATYASMFSFLYLPMLIILFSLIARGAAVEYRGKHEGARWRKAWDRVLAVSSLLAPLVLGLGFGNIFQGLPISGGIYRGTFLGLFNPYGLLTALAFVALFLQHGALWLGMRTTGALADRARILAGRLWLPALALAALLLAATAAATRIYDNYLAQPALFLVPLLAVASLVAVKVLHAGGRILGSFLASSATIVLVVATALVGLFPNLIPSSLEAASSLTIYNSSSSQYTLGIMAVIALVFVPLVVVYQLLVYRFFRAKLDEKNLAEEGGY